MSTGRLMPDLSADSRTGAVAALLAERPLRAVLGDPGAMAVGGVTSHLADASTQADAGRPSIEPSSLPNVSSPADGRAHLVNASAVQRTVTGAIASAVRSDPSRTAPGWRSEQAPEAFGAGPAAVLTQGMRFAPREDGTLWAADDSIAPIALQREPDDPAVVEATPASTPQTMTAVATTGPAARPTEVGSRSEAELQELCRALYTPLHRRLCRDLLVDRERAGYRTDIRF